MNIEDITIRQAKELLSLLNVTQAVTSAKEEIDNKMIGKYVIVRCRDAGVHAGILESHNGRGCVLLESRRLWKWVPAKGKWLSAVANNGLADESKISEPCARIHLTENCEIIECTDIARKSISSMESD